MFPLYREIENSLLDILITIKDRLEILDVNSDLIIQAEEAISFVNSKRYQLAVVGAFKTGKSSLINSLLGIPGLLPEDIVPATATINRIIFGNNKNATVFFYDGKEESISLNELSKYVSKVTPDGKYQASLIKEVVLSMPTVICQNHVEIIDTPGLNDDEEMTAITLKGIENVDAIILTMSQQFQFDDYISNFVCELIKKDSITNIIFVVTHIDDLYETLEDEEITYEEYIELLKNQIKNKIFNKIGDEETYIAKAHKLLDIDKIQLFGISSRLYFDYLLTKNTDKLGKSKFQIFNDNLIPILTSQQMENTIIKTQDNISKIIRECTSLQCNKEKYFETEIGKIIKILKLIKENDLKNIITKSFNEIYFSHHYEYEECLKILNKEKNTVAKEIFNTLITIKNESSNEKVRDLLINKFIEIERKEEEEVFTCLRKQIIALNEVVLQDFLDRNKNELELISNIFDETYLNAFLCNENFIKEHLYFQWTSCPITKNTDCLHTNLMDLFIDEIDVSIEKTKSDLKKLYNSEIPKKSISIISRQIKELESTINLEKEKLEEEKITFKNNYFEFSSKVPELENRVENLIRKYKECC